MRKLLNLTNVDPASPDYPRGRVRDNSGAGDGTPVNENMLGDMLQFFAKLLSDVSINPNNSPENTTNGFQMNDALTATIFSKIKSFGTVENVDLATTNGVYIATGTATNRPVITDADTGYVIVNSITTNGAYVSQIYIKASSDHIYFRRKQAGTWQTWQELVKILDIDDSQIPYITAGVSFLNTAAAGTNFGIKKTLRKTVKIAGVVTVALSSNWGFSKTNVVLPAGYRPTYKIFKSIIIDQTSGSPISGMAIINTDGTIAFDFTSGTGAPVGTFTFHLDGLEFDAA